MQVMVVMPQSMLDMVVVVGPESSPMMVDMVTNSVRHDDALTKSDS